MSGDLVVRDGSDPSDSDNNVQLRYENTVNSPIASAAWLDDGRAVADTYLLEFFESGGSVTCTVVCQTKNWAKTTTESVVADGSTSNKDLVPGVDLVLSASIVSGWEATVTIGQKMNSSATVTDRLAFGVMESDTNSTEMQFASCNVGSDDAAQCKVVALPKPRYTYSAFIEEIKPHTSQSREKRCINLLGDSVITLQNWADGTGDNLGYKTCDIYVGAVKAVDTARFDGVTRYQYGDGHGYVDANDALDGLYIVLALTTADPTSESITMTITDSYTWIQFAQDVSGSAGTYSNSDMTITESGETAGTITASGYAKWWAKMEVPDSATIGDMRSAMVRTRGLTT